MDSIFSRMRAAARDFAANIGRHARAIARLDPKPQLLSSSIVNPFDLDIMHPAHPWTLNPDALKARLPQSCFTKKGPGVTANLRDALIKMTPEQRAVCRNRGWI